MPDPKRAALAVRLAAAVVVEPVRLFGDDERELESKLAFVGFVRSKADTLAGLRGPSFDRALASLPGELAAYDFGDAVAAGSSLDTARHTLVNRLAGGCARCPYTNADGSGPVEAGGPVVCPNRGACISEITSLADAVERLVRSVHAKYASMPGTPLELALQRAHREESRWLLDQFHAAGWTEVGDDETVTVGLHIKDRAFDWPTLCQTLYILAHEMVCHAFQGILGKPRADGADERCSWSEGWMDALAWTLTEFWIERDIAALPGWLHGHDQLKAACHKLHTRRYEFPQPGPMHPIDMDRRLNARSAFYRLALALGGSSGWLAGGRRAAQFSVRLNLCSLSPTERERISVMLNRGLLAAEGSDRLERVVGDCSAFCEHGDPVRLEAELRLSVYGSVQ